MHTLIYAVRLVSPSVSGGKFWTAELYENGLLQVSFGALRSSGQTHEKRFADRNRAYAYLDAKIQEKKRKGYQVGHQKYASTPEPAATPTPKPNTVEKPRVSPAVDSELALRWDF
ncbi:WGR domain-containing protein [Geoalkalibacter halelectricus]|uniref:WGR domain-containing protein n=1 Tax=Geoalkalibacter halelectricus TaxID=2847045 RepID=A0ABY5ZPQ2_9BACT|nr:WGR domain-containing protein [Geoalkalibacter halelectricus]MDO3376522.1 WGR domain-containing protein [Geoalkalibacter halelectricus]UWZ79684.1 WGR domain-containing protein [Geoalkalibacter halelectricus]